MTVLVVKLGGSSAGAPALDGWLDVLCDATLPLVIVPGGGSFADFIRDSQGSGGFTDRAAHAMAILAMEQFGHLLLDASERLAPARTLAEIRNLSRPGRPTVWLPSMLTLWARDIPETWDVTSDSLAAWLADGLDSRTLLLIKQTDAVRPGDTLGDVTAAGIVDPMLETMLPPAIDLYIAGPQHLDGVATEFAAGRVPGVAIGRVRADLRKAG